VNAGIRRTAWLIGAPARAGVIALIRLYRVLLSRSLGGQCRFYPSCSQYAEEAVRVHGAFKGSLMAAWRIVRCGPFTAGGVDYVPRRRAPAYDAIAQRGPLG
jgi:putative membrane protein insertion efficiency factor